ncbi:MAG: S-layer homology domain-containing protein [Bacillota bacterium]|nr:S-layer homology domain-containing protein [Bacillota bacterium]
MKKALLSFALTIVMIMTMAAGVSAESLTNVLKGLDLSNIGNDVNVPVDIKISPAQETNYENSMSEHTVNDFEKFSFKAALDMGKVRKKFESYKSYLQILAGTDTELVNDINNINVSGRFTIKICWPDTRSELAESMRYSGSDTSYDMHGFSFDPSDTDINPLANIKDIYTEVNPETGNIERTYAAWGGCHILTINIYLKHLTYGDLSGTVKPGIDYKTYLGNILLETNATEVFSADVNNIYTVYSDVGGNTNYTYTDAIAGTTTTISHTDYTAVQKAGGADSLALNDVADTSDEVKSKGISATIELVKTGYIKLDFKVDGKYLRNGTSGTYYTGGHAPVYADVISFDPSNYSTVNDIKSSYKFIGWSTSVDGTVIKDVTTFNTDTTLYAVFERISTGGGGGGVSDLVNVKFDIDGDTSLVKLVSGSDPFSVDLNKITVPDKVGYKFKGWYKDKAMTQLAPVDFQTSVTTTLYGTYVKTEVPPQLESVIHFAYVIGYPDGSVKPENNISREEIATIFYRLLTDATKDKIVTGTNNFSDMELSRWSNKAVLTMAAGGYIKGYEDGSFKPEDYITRAEFATIASRFLEENDSVNNTKLTDINGHWAEKYIKQVADSGWITGYEDGTFRPDAYITRAEAMTIINRILNRHINEEGLSKDAKQWSDNLPSAWYYYDVLEATNAHDYKREENETYETWTSINENNVWQDKAQYEDVK